jgi:glycosyltransferase involved in cell wall biosynthesis
LDPLKVAPSNVEGRPQRHPDPSTSLSVGPGSPRDAHTRGMKIGIVVQRYGADINGGAELHARYIAEHLAPHVQVEVLTTCATDYITWRNALAPGTEVVHGVTVRRFPVTRERDPEEFGRHSERVFTATHAVRDELAWLDAEGPTSPALVEHLAANDGAFDFFIFFSFRYYHAYHGVRTVPAKAILVPTAERDGALGLSIFRPVLRGVRALMYNSFEERTMIQAVSDNGHVPGVVVGVGSDIPPHSSATRFRQTFNLRDRFAIYIGRIDENKGCAELFDYFVRYTRMFAEGLHLVLIGNPIISIPQHPRIHHLGFVNDQNKFDALAAAELLIMPSYFESLSMVALEAWALGKPVLANARCDVLRGQCVRSNGGLYYEGFAEFAETLSALDFSPTLAAALGRNGREYFNRHYSWPIIERKYLDMFDRLKRETPSGALEPLPGWLARRRQVLPAANEVVAGLPQGAVLDVPSTTRTDESRYDSGQARFASPPSAVTGGRNTGAPISRPRQPRERHSPDSGEVRPVPSEPGRLETARRGERQPDPRNHRGLYRRRRPGGGPPRRSGR